MAAAIASARAIDVKGARAGLYLLSTSQLTKFVSNGDSLLDKRGDINPEELCDLIMKWLEEKKITPKAGDLLCVKELNEISEQKGVYFYDQQRAIPSRPLENPDHSGIPEQFLIPEYPVGYWNDLIPEFPANNHDSHCFDVKNFVINHDFREIERDEYGFVFFKGEATYQPTSSIRCADLIGSKWTILLSVIANNSTKFNIARSALKSRSKRGPDRDRILRTLEQAASELTEKGCVDLAEYKILDKLHALTDSIDHKANPSTEDYQGWIVDIDIIHSLFLKSKIKQEAITEAIIKFRKTGYGSPFITANHDIVDPERFMKQHGINPERLICIDADTF
jgi:hypothetical protein